MPNFRLFAERSYLVVPYAQRLEAKALGATLDAVKITKGLVSPQAEPEEAANGNRASRNTAQAGEVCSFEKMTAYTTSVRSFRRFPKELPTLLSLLGKLPSQTDR